MKETLDKQAIEEEKGIVEEGELVKENEEKTKEMAYVPLDEDTKVYFLSILS